MTCTPMTAADFFADLLRGQLSRAAEWRQGAPPVPVDAVPPAELPPVIERFFAARLSELQQHVQSLRANDLYEIWTHYVHSYATPFPLLAADPSMEVKETDTLVLVRELPLQYLVSPDRDAVTLYFFDHRLDLSYAAMPLVQAMITHTSFPARQAGLWLGETFAWPDVKALLQELVRAGILQVLSEHQ
jgi:hypothetical protein